MDHKIHHGERRSSFSFLRVGSHKVAEKASPPVHEVIEDPLPSTALEDVLREADLFIALLSSTDDKSTLPEVPFAVESLPAKVDAMVVARSDNDDEDEPLLEAVKRLASLNDLFGEFTSEKPALHHLVFVVLPRATSFLGRRLRSLLVLEDCNYGSRTLKMKSFGKEMRECGLDLPGPSAGSLEDFPGYSESAIPKMMSIAAVMIAAGCEHECTSIYHASRLKALRSALNRYRIEKINVDDVPKLAWEALEGQISSCIRIVKACAAVYFPAERKLCESVFPNHPEVCRHEYARLVKVVVTRLLSFVEAVTLTKRSTDKLFKFLDVYECLRDVMPAIEDSCLECGVADLVGEVSSAKERLVEAAVAIFHELERSIKNDSGRTPVPNGALHPSTRYVMNYLKYTCECKGTLEQVFLLSQSLPAPAPEEEAMPETPATPNDDGTPKTSPFAVQLMRIMDQLDESLEAKSTLYRDASLRLVFLMNNGRYVLQKIKGSAEIHELVGDNCYRRRSSAVRKHHKNYTRETWGRLLQQTLTHQGLRVTNGKLNSKPVLKERLKSFTAMFEEIHKTQSAWVVSDEQLKSELRASVAAVVIPAYRSFLGRFQQFLDPGRQTEKYIKYQPEDIENLIEGLFDGNPSALGRKTRH